MPDALRATREHLSSSISRAGAVREPARRFGAALISRPKNRKGAKISAPNMRVSRPTSPLGEVGIPRTVPLRAVRGGLVVARCRSTARRFAFQSRSILA